MAVISVISPLVDAGQKTTVSCYKIFKILQHYFKTVPTCCKQSKIYHYDNLHIRVNYNETEVPKAVSKLPMSHSQALSENAHNRYVFLQHGCSVKIFIHI